MGKSILARWERWRCTGCWRSEGVFVMRRFFWVGLKASRQECLRHAVRAGLVAMIFALAICAVTEAEKLKQETIEGTVVAYENDLPICLNNTTPWTAIVRLEHPKKGGSRYAHVAFNLRCNVAPEWATLKPAVRKFRVIRREDCVFEKHVETAPATAPAQALPQAGARGDHWTFAEGMDEAKMPYGQKIDCYEYRGLGETPVL